MPSEPDPRDLARVLSARRDVWEHLVEFREPRHYVRLDTGSGWEAWLLTWIPGQSTGLHDHGGAAGAFAVVSGVLEETLPVLVDRPALTGGGAPAATDPDRPRRAHLIGRRYAAGQVRSFGARHIHDVAATTAPAVSIHVYAPELTTMTRYRFEDGLLAVTEHALAGADW